MYLSMSNSGVVSASKKKLSHFGSKRFSQTCGIATKDGKNKVHLRAFVPQKDFCFEGKDCPKYALNDFSGRLESFDPQELVAYLFFNFYFILKKYDFEQYRPYLAEVYDGYFSFPIKETQYNIDKNLSEFEWEGDSFFISGCIIKFQGRPLIGLRPTLKGIMV